MWTWVPIALAAALVGVTLLRVGASRKQLPWGWEIRVCECGAFYPSPAGAAASPVCGRCLSQEL